MNVLTIKQPDDSYAFTSYIYTKLVTTKIQTNKYLNILGKLMNLIPNELNNEIFGTKSLNLLNDGTIKINAR